MLRNADCDIPAPLSVKVLGGGPLLLLKHRVSLDGLQITFDLSLISPKPRKWMFGVI